MSWMSLQLYVRESYFQITLIWRPRVTVTMSTYTQKVKGLQNLNNPHSKMQLSIYPRPQTSLFFVWYWATPVFVASLHRSEVLKVHVALLEPVIEVLRLGRTTKIPSNTNALVLDEDDLNFDYDEWWWWWWIQCTMWLSFSKSSGRENLFLCSHFIEIGLFQTEYLEIVLCSVSLLIYIWGLVEHGHIQNYDLQ